MGVCEKRKGGGGGGGGGGEDIVDYKMYIVQCIG